MVNDSSRIVRANCAQTGSYSIPVKCEEYRNGKKIGEVSRVINIPCEFYNSSSLKEKSNDIIVTVFPNPSSGVFNLVINNSNNKNINVEVLSINGKLELTQQLENTNQQINLTHLKSGIYLIRINHGTDIITKKIVIN